MNRYGPSRGELWGRLGFSLAGLGMMAAALSVRGVPSGPALVEVVGLAGAFFGGTALWSGWRLWQARDPGRGEGRGSSEGRGES